MSEFYEKVIRESKAALLGQTVLSARLSVGSVVLIDFAKSVPPSESPTKSEAYLRVECAWRLENAETVLVASEDEREILLEKIKALNGGVVSGVEVLEPGFDLRIGFDDKLLLAVFPIYANSEEYENWTIHTPEQRVVIAGPGRNVRVLRSEDAG